MTFPELFATGLGVALISGDNRCFWCGASCDSSHRVKVTDTFWDWDSVAYPRSQYQCVGCCEALDEKRDLGKDKLQKTRNYSWLATEFSAKHWTKSDISEMREWCLYPDPVVWGLAIAATGQKHVIYRTPVNAADATTYEVQLELLRVVYTPRQLAKAIDTCMVIVAATGKPALNGPLEAMAAARLPDPQLAREWNARWNQPLLRLASFLCPNKEACNEYFGADDAGAVPQASGRSDGPARQRSLFG